MKPIERRQFGAMFATAALSLGGASRAVASAEAQETGRLQREDASMSLGNTTASFGRVTLKYEDETIRFRGRDWTLSGPKNTLTGDEMRVTVGKVNPEAYAVVQASISDAFDAHSVVPLFAGTSVGELNPDATVRVVTTSIEQNGQVMAERAEATGRLGTVTPDNLSEVSGDVSALTGEVALGPSKWDSIVVELSDSTVEFDDVGITVRSKGANESPRQANLDLSFGEIRKDGKQVVSSFETSGTLAELLSALPTTAADGEEDSKIAVVSNPDTDEILEYTFEVTGDLENLEPGEDSGEAVDEVTQSGDRVRVNGAVGSGDDRYSFTGELVEVDVPEGVKIEIEG